MITHLAIFVGGVIAGLFVAAFAFISGECSKLEKRHDRIVSARQHQPISIFRACGPEDIPEDDYFRTVAAQEERGSRMYDTDHDGMN